MSEILVNELYGREKLLEMASVGSGEHGAFGYSRLDVADRPSESLETINKGRAVPRVENDFDFAWSPGPLALGIASSPFALPPPPALCVVPPLRRASPPRRSTSTR